MWTGLCVFFITYLLISSRKLDVLPLDRPAAALLGAVACVVLGVLSPHQAIAAVDGNTLLLLFGVMGMGTFLTLDGFFDALEGWLVRLTKTPARLLGALVWGSGLLSALITNDTVCVLGAPLVVRLIKRHNLPPLPFLLALCTSANTGSVATLVGNPQNMLCGLLGNLSYADYLSLAAPIAVISLAVNHALLRLSFRGALGAKPLEPVDEPKPVSRESWVTLGTIGATVVAYTAGAHLAWTATAGFVFLMLVHRRDTRRLWPLIDWPLLLFFAGLFVVVSGLSSSGAPAEFFARFPLNSVGETASMGLLKLSLLFLIGSNVVSNVPFILVVQEQLNTLPEPVLAWQLLAVASTFAGNLTLLGSVANVIVAEAAHDIGGFGFFEHLKVGAPLALLTTAIGTAWLWYFG
jgi:Na+/H+ antiporter NhaD/arsenite permease-like protein